MLALSFYSIFLFFLAFTYLNGISKCNAFPMESQALDSSSVGGSRMSSLRLKRPVSALTENSEHLESPYRDEIANSEISANDAKVTNAEGANASSSSTQSSFSLFSFSRFFNSIFRFNRLPIESQKSNAVSGNDSRSDSMLIKPNVSSLDDTALTSSSLQTVASVPNRKQTNQKPAKRMKNDPTDANKEGDSELLERCNADKPEVNAIYPHSDSMLRAAISNQDVALVKKLLDAKVNVNFCGRKLVTPLMSSISLGNIEITQLLLQAGANPNLVTNSTTPLHMCVAQNNVILAQILINAGADLNARVRTPGRIRCTLETPLFEAIYNNEEEMAIFLIRAGANVNAVDWLDHTPLREAVYRKQKEVVKELILAYADKDTATSLTTAPEMLELLELEPEPLFHR